MGLWTRKSLRDLQGSSEEGEHQLKRHLGAFNLILLGIGCIIGAGLFSVTGIAAAENAGPAIIISFIIASFACALAGLCYSEMAEQYKVSISQITRGSNALKIIDSELLALLKKENS